MSADGLDAAFRQDDPVTTWILARSALDAPAGISIAERLLHSRSARLRRLGLDRLLREGNDLADRAARRGLFDRHPGIRETSQTHLILNRDVDAEELYRDSLESSPDVAILGLAETGSARELHRLLTFAAHPRPRVREAVVVAIRRLAPEEGRDTLAVLTRDPSPRVARGAIAAVLSTHPSSKELDDLWALVTREPAGPIVARAFSSLNRWIQLTYAFRAIASGVATPEGTFCCRMRCGGGTTPSRPHRRTAHSSWQR